ncbi:ribonuclease P protein component [Oscillospiraceae bacterium MB08-C2-2]|nr:ribonuclease P protein component [Oscillospiraceae bacterium MB08-C2-2]
MINTISLTENRDFKRAYSKGKTAVHPLMAVYVVKNRKPLNRLGITTSKKIGSAVERNRARRIIREAFRQVESQLPTGLDIVVVARRKTVFAKTAGVTGGLLASCKKLGLLDGGRKAPSEPL